MPISILCQSIAIMMAVSAEIHDFFVSLTWILDQTNLGGGQQKSRAVV